MADRGAFLAVVAAGAALFLLFKGAETVSGRGEGARAGGELPPRGIRNNNPGNIEATGDPWQGMTGDDGRFAIFSDVRYGIRAMTRILDSYRDRGIATLQDILATWAPPSENDTAAYTGTVAAIANLDPAAVVRREDYPAVIEAIIYAENGEQPYSADTIAEGIAWEEWIA